MAFEKEKNKKTNHTLPKSHKRSMGKGKDNTLLYIMMIPFLLYYALFVYKPMYGLVIAFQDYSVFKGISGSPWVGLEHIISFVKNPYFGTVLKNTLVLNFIDILFGFPAPILFALLLNEVRALRLKKVCQTLSYMPFFISTVVVAGIVTNMLSPSYGIISRFIENITGEKHYLLMLPQYFRTIFTTMNIWKTLGYNSVVYIAALSAIDMQLYEAARVDGANRFKQTIHVTLPGILPTIMIMLVMKIGSIISSSTESILLLYQPSTYEVSDVIGTYLYRMGINGAQYSMSAAIGLFQSLVALILVVVANKMSKKLTEVALW